MARKHNDIIRVKDCSRETHDAYWQMTVQVTEEGARWNAKIMSYAPIGYEWDGGVHEKWPDGVHKPVYPAAPAVRQDEYLRLTPEAQARVRAAQDAYRAQCARVYESHPRPVHLIDEQTGVVLPADISEVFAIALQRGMTDDLKHELEAVARLQAQEWVREAMKKRRRKSSEFLSFAGALPLDPFTDLFEEIRYRWRKHVAPLLAIAYSQTVRHNRLHAVRDAIDGGAGAGLLRIYDGARPATCGAATTLGAELTYTDPCAPAASGGSLTFSAITADASANASITATWFRAVDSAGTCCIDGNVGTSGSDMNLNTTTISAGVQVSCSSFVITAGNA